MSIASLHPSLTLTYGVYGAESIIKMARALKAHSLPLSYDESSGEFTIHGTVTMNKQTIKKIFSAHVYKGWKPQVLNKTDIQGNRLVILQQV